MTTWRSEGMNRMYGVVMGAVVWVVGGTAITWLAGGEAWGVGVFVVTMLVTLLTMGMTSINHSFERGVEESRRRSRGHEPCGQCAGGGWVGHDAYNEVTCPVCNGSGFADAPRRGPRRMRGE